ncbi:MAG: protein kinase [Candidatus Melainabacteria bacterium]|nr:protein kinase [Candidatus Melainabacteria bacterium]
MPNHPHSLENHTVIDGTYLVLDFLGEGGMGVVYKVEHTQLKKILALKIIKTNQLSDSVWQRFRNEAQAIARLDHRNVVKIYDMSQTENGRPYYTMDFLTGMSLADYLKANKTLSLVQALHIFRQVCSGLAYAHSRGIIHRDIKPANIMLLTDPKNQEFQVKIVDFGIAKLVDDDGHTIQGLTRPGEVFGSPLYMSPEQCEGRKLDARSDMYSVAVTLFKSLTGSTPFRGRTAIETTMMHQSTAPPLLNSVSADLQYPAKLERIIDKMLSKSPEQRYQSLAEVENELQKLQFTTGQASPVVSFNESHQDDDDEDIEEIEGEDLTETNIASVTSEQAVEHKRLNIKLTVIAVLAFTTIGFSIAMLFKLTKDLAVKKQQPVRAPAKFESPLAAIKDMGNYANETEGGVGQKRSSAANLLLDLPDPTPEIQQFLKEPFKLFSHEKVLSDGTRLIEFQFPEKFSIGTLIDSNNLSKRLDARGAKSFPANSSLRFVANELLGEYPQLLSYFRPTDLVQLRIPKAAKRSDELIANIARLQRLQSLELADCGLKDSDIKTLESLDNLRTLNISRSPVAGDVLARSTLLAKLSDLNIERMRNGGTVIHSLGSMTRKLCLNDCVLSAADLKKLATLSSLEVLSLKGCNIRDQDLSILAGMKKLASLNIEDCNQLTAKSVSTIKTFTHLRVIYLSPRLKNETVTQILKSALPELKVQ